MSRSVWTKRSSIVAMSLLKNPMGVFSFLRDGGAISDRGAFVRLVVLPIAARVSRALAHVRQFRLLVLLQASVLLAQVPFLMLCLVRLAGTSRLPAMSFI